MESRFYREKRVKMYRVQTICHTVDPIKTKPGVILNSKGFYVLSEQNRTEVVFNILRGPGFKQTFHSGRILKMAIQNNHHHTTKFLFALGTDSSFFKTLVKQQLPFSVT